MTHPRMTPTNDAPVTVEQCDREAAAKLAEWLTSVQQEWDGMPLWFAFDAPRAFRAGAFDSHEFVQSHARHRLAALARPRAAVGERDDICAVMEGMTRTEWDDWVAYCGKHPRLLPRIASIREKADNIILALQSTPAKVGERE